MKIYLKSAYKVQKKIYFEIIKGKSSLVPWKHTTNFGLTSDTVCLQVELENNSSIIKIKK